MLAACLLGDQLQGNTGYAGFFLSGRNTRPEISTYLLDLPLKFDLYSRSNCPLCETMEDDLRPFIAKYSITVERHYIDNDAALQTLYGEKVPVLALDDKILCHYFLDTDRLLNAIGGKV